MCAFASILTALGLTSTPAIADSKIACMGSAGSEIQIDMAVPSEFGDLICVYGAAYYDIKPYTLPGKYGLSFPTGRASLADVVDH
jgi:hypothetical protein